MANPFTQKSAAIDKAQEVLTQVFADNSQEFARVVSRMVGQGIFDIEIFVQELSRLGYEEIILDSLDEFNIIFNYSKEMFEKTGLAFIWTAENEVNMQQLFRAKGRMLLNNSMRKYASEIVDYAVNAKLSEKPKAQILLEMKERFETEGRRVGAEVHTALSTFDRAAESQLYDNAGIERFIYAGPKDDRTRESCQAVLNAQASKPNGWTRKEINAFPGVDFIQGGYPYYNCRHKFVPFVPEIEALIEEEISENAD